MVVGHSIRNDIGMRLDRSNRMAQSFDVLFGTNVEIGLTRIVSEVIRNERLMIEYSYAQSPESFSTKWRSPQ
jgi:hypothetical protein